MRSIKTLTSLIHKSSTSDGIMHKFVFTGKGASVLGYVNCWMFTNADSYKISSLLIVYGIKT
jgi:hypothetical protein